MNVRLSLSVLALALASPGSAQYGEPQARPWKAYSQDPAVARASVIETLHPMKSDVDRQAAILDGMVSAGVVLAGDGRLKNLLKESGRLVKALEGGLKWSREIAASGPPSRAPFDEICKNLTGKDCQGGGSGDGLLTALKAEEGRLREALARVKTSARSTTVKYTDPCDDARDESSAARTASRATTRLAVITAAINTSLAPGGELSRAFDAAAAQGAQAGKKGKDITAFAKRAKSESIKRQKSLMKALTGKEKLGKEDVEKLTHARGQAYAAVGTFEWVEGMVKSFPPDAIGQDNWAKASTLLLENAVALQGARETAASIAAMLDQGKIYLVGGAAGGADPKSTTGIFPALKKSEETVRRACAVRDGLGGLLASLQPAPTRAPSPGP